jgi:Flp pilus assembly protein TadG
MRKFLKRLFRQTNGGAALEFGIVFPIFAVLIVGIAEYGMVMVQIMAVNNAAQIGANYAMLNGYNPTNTNIQNAVNAATGIPKANVTVAEMCGCANGATISSLGCGPPMPLCGSQTAGAYVTVTVSQAYSPVAPGIPSPLKAAALVRVLQ